MARKKVGGRQKDKEFLPTLVPGFDRLIEMGGLERGSIMLLSGPAGSGKSLFALQSAYQAALRGEKVVYFTLEEEPQDISERLLRSFGWDIAAVEKKGNMLIRRVAAEDVARSIESRFKEKGIEDVISSIENIRVEPREITMPFHPDRFVMDPLSALMPAFSNQSKYRAYLGILFDSLRSYRSVNLLVGETAEGSCLAGRAEEHLADGVVCFGSGRKGAENMRTVKICKLRFSGHSINEIPFTIGKSGIVVKEMK